MNDSTSGHGDRDAESPAGEPVGEPIGEHGAHGDVARLAEQSSGPAIGLVPGTVRLAPYHAAWRPAFEAERAEILARLGPHILDVQHIGSTAIPGIVAKPVIDIAVAVASFEEAFVCVAPLEAYGYRYYGEHGIPRRHYFSKGDPRTHHLHMMEIGSEEWRKHLLFRDYLLAHPDAAADYARLKRELASRFPADREAYTEGKSGFILDVVGRAAAWRAGEAAPESATPLADDAGNGQHPKESGR